ncbi:MAG: LamG domain-containing protein, partial [Verrucomicrobiota bacterium]
ISKNLYDGEWHHLVWVIDDCVNNSMKVYVDGAEAALSLTSTGSPDEFGNLTDVVFFGGLNNRGTDLIRPFNGTLDEIAVYDYALGAEDVMIHYNAMLPSLGGTFIVIK